MPGRQGHERVHGPYAHGNRWRVIYVGANGASEVESFESREAAQAAADTARKTADARTVGQAVQAYLDTRGEKDRQTTRYRLYGVLRVLEGDRPLMSLNAALARRLYDQRCNEGLSGATMHGELAYAKRWGAWCVANGWLRINPFDGIEPRGEVNRGKAKLRVNASRQFLEYLAGDESLEATAVLTAFVLGMRASSVVNRTVEDLDDCGRLLWIRNDKSRAGDREIEVPELLRHRLLALAANKHPTERLFGALTRYGLHYHTIRLCAAAGVPRVTPHGLRGSGATRAVRLGGSVEEVAAAIGHADNGVTLRRNYLGGGAEESARGRQIASLLPEKDPTRELTYDKVDSDLVTDADFALPTNKMREEEFS